MKRFGQATNAGPAAWAADTSTWGCGFWIAPPTSERSSMRLIRVWPASAIGSNFT